MADVRKQHTRPLGKNQRGVLRALQSDRYGGVWYPGCGWIWSTRSETERLLDSLVNRGLATREERTAQRGAPGRYQFTVTYQRYEITDAGRAVDAT